MSMSKLTKYGLTKRELKKRGVLPKGCYVYHIDLDGRGSAELSLNCRDDSAIPRAPLYKGLVPRQAAGPDYGVFSTYPKFKLKAVEDVVLADTLTSIAGKAEIHFQKYPTATTCERIGRGLVCGTKTKRIRWAKG